MNDFKAGDVVKILSSGQIGAVLRTLHNFETITYEVLVNGEKLLLDCTQIRRVDTSYDCFENREEFDAALSALAIVNPGKDLFSLNSGKIDFIPYQYRPVLKIIKADEPRILIADDVGVGKTIEAGLIVKELSARQSMNSIMIFCPRPLVAEGKWLNEMRSKFNEKFQHMDRKTLKNAIKECDYEGEWIEDYGRCIIPYSILDEELLTGAEGVGKKEVGLLDLNPAPRFGLVIVDEAHHIRNQNTQAYKVIQYFCMHAEAVVFLSATPIQLGDRDLFVLLNLLRPDYILDEETFRIMSEPNPYINTAIDQIRGAKEGWQELAFEALQNAQATEWARRTPLGDEIGKLSERIQLSKTNSEERVVFISELERLHTFSGIINRTRKRDIGNFTTRKPLTLRSDFSAKQQELYDALIEVQTKILLKKYKESMIKFLMSTLYRQAASCIFGLAPCMEDILTRHISVDTDIDDSFENYGNEYVDIEITEDVQAEIKKVLSLAKNIDDTDNKYDSLVKIVREKQTYQNNKIMIFSAFRHTLGYLYNRLVLDGYRVGLVTGAVKDEERRSLRERFRLSREDESAVDIMLFSEVGCEGLDYQFCDCMVNYDLPWNPMRIEQRIGRIDRNGQKSESVLIYNMITNGTVDADIYDRCLMRIGIFNQTIGCGEEILGEIAKGIQDIAVDYTLSANEKDDKLRQLADNKVRLLNENQIMEENQYDFLSIRMPYEDDKRRIQEFTNYWLTPEKLENVIECYLLKKYDKKVLIYTASSTFEIRFSKDEKNEILSEYYALKSELAFMNRTWVNFLKGSDASYRYTFDSAVSKNKDICLMGATHPLVQLAGRFFINKVKQQVILQYRNPELTGREIGFAIYEWRYAGDRNLSELKIITDQQDVKGCIEQMIMDSKVVDRDLPGRYNEFTEIHGKLWSAEREKYKAKQIDIYTRRQESLKLSYKKRLETIKNQENSTESTNIRRMKQKEYENVSNDLDFRIRQLNEQKEKVDIISRFVCAGVIVVEE